MLRQIWALTGRHYVVSRVQARFARLVTPNLGRPHQRETSLSRRCAERHPIRRSLATHSAAQQSPKELDAVHPEILAELVRRGFQLSKVRKGEFRTICPKCDGGSTREVSLACRLEEDGFVWFCHRATCGDSGHFSPNTRKGPTYVKPDVNLLALDTHWQTFFKDRGISQQTLQRNKIAQEKTGNLAFPYLREGELVNVKFRVKFKKAFYQSRDTEKILYGWDDINGQQEVIIVEGEVDKLSMEEAGFLNVASIPEGAPAKVQPGPLPSPAEDTKFGFLWNSQSALAQAQRVLLAVDNDEPGRVLAAELARRLGPETCWLVSWSLPTSFPPRPRRTPSGESMEPPTGNLGSASRTYKDANEVLLAEGPDALKLCIRAARPFPVPGLKSIDVFADAILSGKLRGSRPSGMTIGWKSLDDLYAVKPGVVTVISGPPLSGKTELALNILQSLSRYPFAAAICLLDGQDAKQTVIRLLEKHTGQTIERMSQNPALLRERLVALSRGTVIVDLEEPLAASLERVLNILRIACKRHNLRGIVLDSFQGFHPQPASAGEVAAFMREIKDFAKQHGLHVWLISHSLNTFQHKDLLLVWSDVGLTLQRTQGALNVGVTSQDPQSARPGRVALKLDAETGRVSQDFRD